MPKLRIVDVENRWNRENEEDEYLWWPRTQWIDPGGTSGVAILWFDPVALFDEQPMARVLLAVSEMYLSGPETGINGQVNRFMRLHRTLNQEIGLATGSESFQLRTDNRDEDVLSPVRIRATIEYELSITKPVGEDKVGNGIPLHTQTPADAKGSYTNDRLRSLGLYTPGPDHINDAKRHALLHLRKVRAAGVEAFKLMHGNEEGWWS